MNNQKMNELMRRGLGRTVSGEPAAELRVRYDLDGAA